MQREGTRAPTFLRGEGVHRRLLSFCSVVRVFNRATEFHARACVSFFEPAMAKGDVRPSPVACGVVHT